MNINLRAAQVAVLAWLSACGVDQATQVVLVVEADARTQELTQELRVVVYDNDNVVVSEATNNFDIRARIPLVPRGDDASRGYRVLIEGLSEDGVTVVRAEAQGGYSDGDKVERNVPLREACHFVLCGPGLSCAGEGRCEPACNGGDCVEDPRSNAVYIDAANGSDDNDCTQAASPCATFEAAVEQLSSGAKRIYFSSNELQPAVTIGSALSGTSEAPTLLQGIGTARTVIASTASTPTIHVQNASDVIVAGFEIRTSAQYGILVENAERVTITGTVFAPNTYSSPDADAAGIYVDDSSVDVTITGNTIGQQGGPSGTRVHALSLGGTGVRVVGNDLSDNQSFGIVAFGEFGLTASFNRISGNVFDGVGLYPGSFSSGATLRNNWICANTHGVSTNQLIDVVLLEHNTFYGNNTNGLQVYDNATRGTATADNNLFIENGGFGIAIDAGSVRGRNNGFVLDDTSGDFISDAPESNIDVTAPNFEDVGACRLRASNLPRAADGSRIGAL